MLAARSNAARILTIATFVWLIAILYCKINFYRDPGSAFFDENRAFIRVHSAYREEQSVKFLERSSEHPQKASASPSMCAVFLSVKRIGEQPLDVSIGSRAPLACPLQWKLLDVTFLDESLTQSQLAIASALEGMFPQERADIHVGVLFAHTNPEDHPSWRNPRLRNLVDEAFSYNTTSQNHTMIQDWETSHNYKRKGVFDYTYGLEYCLNTTKSPYIAIFEDDVIFAAGWLLYTLNNLSNLQMRLATQANDWLFLRLFNQERSIGWASRDIGGNHEFLITTIIAIPLVAVILLLRRRYPRVHRYMDNWTLAIVCLVIIPAFIVLFYQAGKASLLPPRPGIRDEAFGCCSQGLVFPREEARPVVDMFRHRGSGQVDLILNDIADDKGLTRYAQYPVVMQHLGKLVLSSRTFNLTLLLQVGIPYAEQSIGKHKRYGAWRLNSCRHISSKFNISK
jgi:GR25 family glycosyltransferase involved in LPS biosynthesis